MNERNQQKSLELLKGSILFNIPPKELIEFVHEFETSPLEVILEIQTEPECEDLLSEDDIVGALSKTGVVVGAASVLIALGLYKTYKKIRQIHQQRKYRCTNLPKFQRDDCVREARVNELEDKIKAVRQLMSKGGAKAQKPGQKEINKLMDRIHKIQNG